MTPEEMREKLCVEPGDDVLVFVRELGYLPGEFLGVDDEEGVFYLQREGRINPSRIYVDHVVLLEKIPA